MLTTKAQFNIYLIVTVILDNVEPLTMLFVIMLLIYNNNIK